MVFSLCAMVSTVQSEKALRMVACAKKKDNEKRYSYYSFVFRLGLLELDHRSPSQLRPWPRPI